MVKLQYYCENKQVDVSEWTNEAMAWISLGGDDFNYRTIDRNGKVLTDKSVY